MPKEKKEKGKPHATQSFAQMMSQAQVNALKPYVEQRMEQFAKYMFQAMLANAKNLSLEIDAVKKGLEKYTKFTNEEFNEFIWIQEDEELKLTSKEVASEGDKVRIYYDIIKDGNREAENQFCVFQKLEIDGKGPEYYKAIQKEIIGMKVGEVKTVETKDEDKSITYDFKVVRISEYPKKEETDESKK